MLWKNKPQLWKGFMQCGLDRIPRPVLQRNISDAKSSRSDTKKKCWASMQCINVKKPFSWLDEIASYGFDVSQSSITCINLTRHLNVFTVANTISSARLCAFRLLDNIVHPKSI